MVGDRARCWRRRSDALEQAIAALARRADRGGEGARRLPPDGAGGRRGGGGPPAGAQTARGEAVRGDGAVGGGGTGVVQGVGSRGAPAGLRRGADRAVGNIKERGRPARVLFPDRAGYAAPPGQPARAP